MTSPLTFVLYYNGEPFQTSVLPHLKACEDLFNKHPDCLKEVYIFNFPDKDSLAMASLKQMSLWSTKRVQLFASLSTSEILDHFVKRKNVVYMTGERSPLMVEADSRGLIVFHNVASMTRDSVGTVYDPSQLDILFEHLCKAEERSNAGDGGPSNAGDGGPLLVLKTDIPVHKSITLSGISKTFVINLDRRPDRWELFKKNHSQLHPMVTRVSAVDGRKIQLTPEIAHMFRDNKFKSMKGVMGCALSHYNLWKQLANSNDEAYFIMEDDAKCSPDFFEKFNQSMKRVPSDFEILYVGGLIPQNQKLHNFLAEPINECVGRIKEHDRLGIFGRIFPYTTMAYCITNQGAKKLLQIVAKYKITRPVDWFMAEHAGQLMKQYHSIPFIVTTTQFDDPNYVAADMANISHTNNFDSDICNQPECFTEEEIKRVLETPLHISHENNLTTFVGLPVSKAFVINLDRRPDRYKLFQTNHPLLHPHVIRTSAVDGKQIQLTPELVHLFRNNDFKWMKGVMGCALSHYHLWQQLAESNDSAYLMLEDDVKCVPDFLNQFDTIMKHIPLDADILYLGGVHPKNITRYNSIVEPVNKCIGRLKQNTYCGTNDSFFHFGAYSYVLTKKGAKTLVSKIKKVGIYQAIDIMLGRFVNEVNIYVSLPLLATVFQDDDPEFVNAGIEDISNTNKYDSDICNQPECFTEEDLKRVIETPILISYDNKPTENTLFFEGTLKRNGWSYKFIGEGDTWKGYVATRATSYKKYLETIPKETLVILSDARDVVCLRNPSAFTQGFRSFGTNILISMELFCEGKLDPPPDHDKTKWQCEPLDKYWTHLGIKQPIRKFANAGLMAGKAGALADMLGWIIDKGFTDDQLGVGNYMNTFPDKIAADYDAQLVHSSTFGCYAGIQDVQVQATDSPTFAELFGRSAFFLHVPGLHLKGQRLVYDQVKQMIQRGVCDSMMTSLYEGFKEPGWPSHTQSFSVSKSHIRQAGSTLDMKVYFHNFWPGFLEKLDPINVEFFLLFLSRVFKTNVVVGDKETSTILVESVFGKESALPFKQWSKTFLFSGEPFFPTFAPLESYSCILGFMETKKNYVCLPLFLPYILSTPLSYTPVVDVPNKFACTVISNPHGRARNAFLDYLEKCGSVTYGGNFRNNIGKSIQGNYKSNVLIDFYRQFKFVITMENNEEPHYVTEKIINGFRAGIIPVYWGSPNIHRYFHKDRFLTLPNDSIESIKTLAHQMVTMTNEEYMRRVNLPIFKEGFGLDNVVNDTQQCIAPAIEHFTQVKRPKFDIRCEHDATIDTEKHETEEQALVYRFIQSNDVVLELGARYGSVSCMINYKLTSKTSQVVVEPDERVWDALERNKRVNKCEFAIIKGFISSKQLGLTGLNICNGGYGATFVEASESKIPSYTLAQIEAQHKLKFNVLVADCEGFLETFFDENPTFVNQLHLIIFEEDGREKCNYVKIRTMLKHNGFRELAYGAQNVWKR